MENKRCGVIVRWHGSKQSVVLSEEAREHQQTRDMAVVLQETGPGSSAPSPRQQEHGVIEPRGQAIEPSAPASAQE